MAQSFSEPVIRYEIMMHGIASKNKLRKKIQQKKILKVNFKRNLHQVLTLPAEFFPKHGGSK